MADRTDDWATQAWLNIAAILDRGGHPDTATLDAFLAQAPPHIRDTAIQVRLDSVPGEARTVLGQIGEHEAEVGGHAIDPDLEALLHDAFDRYGTLGVITAAASYGLRNATPTPCDGPHLGLATTGQLLAEISARIEIHGPGLDYRTVDPA